MHFIREYPKRKKKGEKDFQVVTATSIKHRFRSEIEILECEEAKQKISEHPKCPFHEFAFTGVCEIDPKWYYLAANGSIFLPTTQIILMENKETNMKEILEKRTKFDHEKIQEFDSSFEDFKGLLFSDLELIYSTLDNMIKYGFTIGYSKTEKNKLHSALLLWKTSNTLLGGYQILRLGFFDESLSLCRMALENAALSYSIHKDTEIYKKYCRGKFKTTEAISEAKKFDPLFGNSYGRLSKTVHPISDLAVPHGKFDRETKTLELTIGGVFKPEDKFIYNDAFVNLCTVGYLTTCLVEFMFYRFVKQHKYCQREGDNIIFGKTEAVNEALELFKRLKTEDEKN